jgi:hypothetical protein
MAISRSDLLKLAKSGAATRLEELRAEIDGIYRSFPDLRRKGTARAAAKNSGTGVAGRRKWTASQRKAAAERMRKYWAAKRGKK